MKPMRPILLSMALLAVSGYTAKPGDISPSLQSVARIVNLCASAGVPLSHLQFVVVIDSAAIDAVLDNTHYREKYGVDNPNLVLIRRKSSMAKESPPA